MVLNIGRMPCAPRGDFLVTVENKDLQGFKKLGGLVGIIGRVPGTKRLYERFALSDSYARSRSKVEG